MRDNWIVAAGASPVGTMACPPTWVSDFRADLAKFDVPTLVVHGDADALLPVEATARRIPEFVADCEVVKIAGAAARRTGAIVGAPRGCGTRAVRAAVKRR